MSAATASISYPHPYAAPRFASAAVATLQQSSNDIGPAKMATCYPAYELANPHQTVSVPQRTVSIPQRTVPIPQRTVSIPQRTAPQKDYSRPLHVDCSVEYELPNAAKPPQGVRNEPLLMIHPCYFRKIESQRRSPFINNLPAAKRRKQQVQMPQLAAQYPVPWEPMPPLVPISAAQTCCKQQAPQQTYCSSSGSDSGHWTDPDRSPDRPEDKHILSGKYRQYLRAHRLHPYGPSIPLAATFPHQIQQVCYNV